LSESGRARQRRRQARSTSEPSSQNAAVSQQDLPASDVINSSHGSGKVISGARGSGNVTDVNLQPVNDVVSQSSRDAALSQSEPPHSSVRPEIWLISASAALSSVSLATVISVQSLLMSPCHLAQH